MKKIIIDDFTTAINFLYHFNKFQSFIVLLLICSIEAYLIEATPLINQLERLIISKNLKKNYVWV